MIPLTPDDRRQGDDERRGGVVDRRRGRPPLSEDTSALSLRLPGTLHDRLVHTAARRGDDVSTTHRQLLEFALVAEAMLFVSQKPERC